MSKTYFDFIQSQPRFFDREHIFNAPLFFREPNAKSFVEPSYLYGSGNIKCGDIGYSRVDVSDRAPERIHVFALNRLTVDEALGLIEHLRAAIEVVRKR